MASEVVACQMSPWRRQLQIPIGTLGFSLQPSHVSGMPLQGVAKWWQLLGGVLRVRGSHTAGAPLLPGCLLVRERQLQSPDHRILNHRGPNHRSLSLPTLLLKAVDRGRSDKLGQGGLPSAVPVIVSVRPFYMCGICLDTNSSLPSESASQSPGYAPGAK